MKSVIQEASSLSKAIEQGWIKAGKPKEFTVKIFQNSEKGFLGLGVKQMAKIGIFFEETQAKPRFEGQRQQQMQRSRPEGTQRRKGNRQEMQRRERQEEGAPRERQLQRPAQEGQERRQHHERPRRRQQVIPEQPSQPLVESGVQQVLQKENSEERPQKKIINAFEQKK